MTLGEKGEKKETQVPTMPSTVLGALLYFILFF